MKVLFIVALLFVALVGCKEEKPKKDEVPEYDPPAYDDRREENKYNPKGEGGDLNGGNG